MRDEEEALTGGAAKEVECLSASLLEQARWLGLAGPVPQPPCARGPTERIAEEGPATSGPRCARPRRAARRSGGGRLAAAPHPGPGSGN